MAGNLRDRLRQELDKQNEEKALAAARAAEIAQAREVAKARAVQLMEEFATEANPALQELSNVNKSEAFANDEKTWFLIVGKKNGWFIRIELSLYFAIGELELSALVASPSDTRLMQHELFRQRVVLSPDQTHEAAAWLRKQFLECCKVYAKAMDR